MSEHEKALEKAKHLTVKGSEEKFGFSRMMKTKKDRSQMHLKGETRYPTGRFHKGREIHSLHKEESRIK